VGGMSIGAILFVIGLVSLIGKGEGEASMVIGFGSMSSCALIWLLVDIANAVDDIARIRQASGTGATPGHGQQTSVSGCYQPPSPPKKGTDE
jgi:hypothetical protein